jgi:hypothetical protein
VITEWKTVSPIAKPSVTFQICLNTQDLLIGLLAIVDDIPPGATKQSVKLGKSTQMVSKKLNLRKHSVSLGFLWFWAKSNLKL